MSTTYELVCVQCKQRLWVGQSGWNPERNMSTMYVYGTGKHLRALGWFFHEHFGHKLRFVSEHAFGPEEYGELGDCREFEAPEGPVPRL